MSFDPMAAAIDWLDPYRAGDLDVLLNMYEENAVIDCGCAGKKTVTTFQGIRSYWVHRLRNYPAVEMTFGHRLTGP
jgi:hypothetical protein